MFIATRLPSNHSAKSEMLSISLFAEEDMRLVCGFYKHHVPTARCRSDRSTMTFELGIDYYGRNAYPSEQDTFWGYCLSQQISCRCAPNGDQAYCVYILVQPILFSRPLAAFQNGCAKHKSRLL